MAGIDVLVVGGENTTGWRVAAEQLAGSLARAGAQVEVALAPRSRRVRTFALTDLVQAWAARRAARQALARYEPRAIVYCSITAALLWPRPGAIYLDSLAAENRPGRHGIWQRPVERRRLTQAPLVLAFSPRSLEVIAPPSRPETVVVPVPVEGRPSGDYPRDVPVVTYAGDPVKRRLSLVLGAWERARHDGEALVVAGTDLALPPAGVQSAGSLPGEEFRRLLGRSRVFVAAPVREDYGIAALEALACGCIMVSTPASGPYPALELARELDPRLVGDDLAGAIRIALEDPRPDYQERAAVLLAPFTASAVDRTVADRVLPRLLARP